MYLSQLGAILAGLLVATHAFADSAVSLTAKANPDYTARKYEGDKPKKETYVFMQGKYFEGGTVDGSIDKMPFRRIAEYLAPELAKQHYFPVKEIKEADLLIIVHWGTTLPHVSRQEMTGRTSSITDSSNGVVASILAGRASMAEQSGDQTGMDLAARDISENNERQLNADRLEQITDQISNDMTSGTNVSLLGYSSDLRKFRNDSWQTEEERALRYDLAAERYFIIVKAFDLHTEAGTRRRPVWSLYLNISSPGNNFRTAMDRMSLAAVNYFGRTTDSVKTVKLNIHKGRVDLAPLLILGEAK